MLLATGSNINGRLGIIVENTASNKINSVCRVLTPVRRQKLNCEEEGSSSTSIPSISCGRSHSLLVEDGQLYGWGCNDYGQVGIRKSEDEIKKISFESSVSSYSSSIPTHNNDGSDITTTDQQHLYNPCSSSSSQEVEGKTEDDPEEDRYNNSKVSVSVSVSETTTTTQHAKKSSDITAPTHVPIPSSVVSSERIIQVSCGAQHSLCTTQSGKVYSWGCGLYGATGHGDEITRFRPERIQDGNNSTSALSLSLLFHQEVIVGVCAGQNHSLALSQRGAVFSFGRGQEGQLGDGHPLSLFQKSQIQNQSQSQSRNKKNAEIHCRKTPYHITALDEPAIIVTCSNGGHGSYAVLANGYAVRWGALCNTSCCEMKMSEMTLNDSKNPNQVSTPFPLPSPLGATSESSIFPSDNNASTTTTSTTAAAGAESSSSIVISISAGINHVICVTRAGEAWSLGQPGAHLGIGPACQYPQIRSPSRMLLPGDALVNGVSCGERHTLLSTTDGRIFACGDASFGKLGLINQHDLEMASDAMSAIPKALPLLPSPNDDNDNTNRNDDCDDKKSNEVLYGTYIGPMNYARIRVVQHWNQTSFLNHHPKDAPVQGTIFKLKNNLHGTTTTALNPLDLSPSSSSVPLHVNVNVTPKSPDLEHGCSDNDNASEEDELSYELDMEYFSAAQNDNQEVVKDHIIAMPATPQTVQSDDGPTTKPDIVHASSSNTTINSNNNNNNNNNNTLGRLSYEAKRKLSHGGRILWGASGAILNNVVTRVTGNASISTSSVHVDHLHLRYQNADVTTDSCISASVNQYDATARGRARARARATGMMHTGDAAEGIIVGSSVDNSHQDSFDGLLLLANSTSKARRKVLLAAGGSSSLVYVLDDSS